MVNRVKSDWCNPLNRIILQKRVKLLYSIKLVQVTFIGHRCNRVINRVTTTFIPRTIDRWSSSVGHKTKQLNPENKSIVTK